MSCCNNRQMSAAVSHADESLRYDVLVCIMYVSHSSFSHSSQHTAGSRVLKLHACCTRVFAKTSRAGKAYVLMAHFMSIYQQPSLKIYSDNDAVNHVLLDFSS